MTTQKRSPIFLLDPETTSSSGSSFILQAIDEIQTLSNSIASTLGPFGRDKLIITKNDFVVSNDGAFILSSLPLSSPIADIIRQISLSQDNVAGDGTTTVCLLACHLLLKLKKLISNKMSIKDIEENLLLIEKLSLEYIDRESKNIFDYRESFENSYFQSLINGNNNLKAHLENSYSQTIANPTENNPQEKNNKNNKSGKSDKIVDFEKNLFAVAFSCARTSLASKILNTHASFFSALIINSLTLSAPSVPRTKTRTLNTLNYILEPGSDSIDSFLFPGIVFKKPFSYAGFERSPKLLRGTRIVLIDLELEITSDKENMELRVDSAREYDRVIAAEFELFREKLDYIVSLLGLSGLPGADNGEDKDNGEGGVVVGSMPIGDFATQYFSERGVYAVGRVDLKTIKKISRVCGCRIFSNINNIPNDPKGTASENDSGEFPKGTTSEGGSLKDVGDLALFEERRIGNNRYILTQPTPDTAPNKIREVTVVLRGGSRKYLEEAQRSLNDAAKTSSTVLLSSGEVLLGAGAFEISLSEHLSSYLSKNGGACMEEVFGCFKGALEFMVEQLANNAGWDGLEIVGKMKAEVKNKGKVLGVDLEKGCVSQSVRAVEPVESRKNVIRSCVEAACLVVRISECVKDRPTQKVE